MSMDKNRLECIELIKRQIDQDKADIQRKIEKILEYAYDVLSSETLHQAAARLKVYAIVLRALEDQTVAFDEIQSDINRHIREAAASPLNCTSSAVNLMQVYYCSAWVDVYQDLFGWY